MGAAATWLVRGDGAGWRGVAERRKVQGLQRQTGGTVHRTRGGPGGGRAKGQASAILPGCEGWARVPPSAGDSPGSNWGRAGQGEVMDGRRTGQQAAVMDGTVS